MEVFHANCKPGEAHFLEYIHKMDEDFERNHTDFIAEHHEYFVENVVKLLELYDNNVKVGFTIYTNIFFVNLLPNKKEEDL